MDKFQLLSIAGYAIGLILWFALWQIIIGYRWIKKEPYLHISLWGCAIVLVINIVLTWFSTTPEYAIEIGIYEFVEKNGIVVAGFSMAIAVFVIIVFKDQVDILKHDESRKFLQLVFVSFLVVVLGVLPLYWIPQKDGWLTLLRNLKTVPYTYSLFILSSAIIIYLHILRKEVHVKKSKKNGKKKSDE